MSMTDEGPLTAADVMRRLGLTLALRPMPLDAGDLAATDEDSAIESWDCILRREDGRAYELADVTFVVYDEDGEHAIEPSPSTVLELLREVGGLDDDEEDDEEAEIEGAASGFEPEAAADVEAVRQFLGLEGVELLRRFAA
jgi:hypothetical protein